MPVKITIIGLGQIGASIGLALAPHTEKVITTGHDKDYSLELRARKLGAVNETNHNLPNSVKNADLVILALPIQEIRDTFRYIALDLRKDSVVMDTAPIKVEVSKWAREVLPQRAHYLGVVPAIGPEHLHLMGSGLDSARADLFNNGIFLLSAPRGTPGEAVDLASGIINLLGSTTILTDIAESDGVMTSAHLLPQLTSAALLNATVNQPGWAEVKKSASRGYFSAISALPVSSVDGLAMLAKQDRTNVIRSLNNLMNALLDLRDDLENEDHESFLKRLKSAEEGRADWLFERDRAEWTRMPDEKVERQSLMESLFGSKLGRMGKGRDSD